MYELIQKRDYYCPSRYIRGRITEYDIKACNINMLLYYDQISIDTYNFLNNIPKYDREVYIGNMIKENPDIYKVIANGIKEFKTKLAEANNISDNEIIRIANDAVFINRSIDLQITQFDNILFANKGTYSSALKILDKHTIVFVGNDNYGNNIVEVKGLGDNAILHQNYMLSIIVSIINTMEKSSVKDALALLNDIYKDYVNLRLDKGFYREFNSSSLYKYKDLDYGAYYIDNINDIDISYNLSILRELWSILIEQGGNRI